MELVPANKWTLYIIPTTPQAANYKYVYKFTTHPKASGSFGWLSGKQLKVTESTITSNKFKKTGLTTQEVEEVNNLLKHDHYYSKSTNQNRYYLATINLPCSELNGCDTAKGVYTHGLIDTLVKHKNEIKWQNNFYHVFV